MDKEKWKLVVIVFIILVAIAFLLCGCRGIKQYKFEYFNDEAHRVKSASYLYDDSFNPGWSDGEGKTLLDLDVKGIGI